ncbi:hypothetical protein PN498_10820 [Oscillatoria sp. CS-180]|uniref:hypothetical protein n=1 Tax=Oscillatoria sp. CS-180 TaxID=3021720 RepID=UPI00232C7ED2|nr:hypothetical protein [Oscillatoria sp. CS-180]MDB9526482.1 hypothetical protein [Oscillatoria sp. CS-180]
MPRRIDPKCLDCTQLSTAEAREQHGPQGDNCWVESRCHRKRSHYRNRRDNNAARRSHYNQERQQQKDATAPETLTFPLAIKPVAYLYLYRQKRQDAPLHAIAVSVWEGSKRVLEVEPIHCAGMRNQQIQRYLMDVLKTLRERFGITKFEPEIRLEPTECPIVPCPLKPAAIAEADE